MIGEMEEPRRQPGGQSLNISPRFPDGGAATARPRSAWIDEGGKEHVAWAQNGMTIRDAMATQIAGHYLEAKLNDFYERQRIGPAEAVKGGLNFEDLARTVASVSYLVADALIEQRKK